MMSAAGAWVWFAASHKSTRINGSKLRWYRPRAAPMRASGGHGEDHRRDAGGDPRKLGVLFVRGPRHRVHRIAGSRAISGRDGSGFRRSELDEREVRSAKSGELDRDGGRVERPTRV